MDQSTETIDAVSTSCSILSTLQEHGPMGVTELATELNLSKSTAHRHIISLRAEKFVVKSGDKYQLSLRFLAMFEQVIDQLGIFEVIKNTLDELAEETGEVAQFAVEEQEELVYIYKSEGEQAIRVVSDMGYQGNFHCTGLGKAILSHLPEEKIDKIIERHGLKQKTENTITSRERLNDELAEIRDQGYATDDEEFMEGLKCVAAPVYVNEPELVGGVSVSAPARRINDNMVNQELIEEVLDAANVIEVNSMVS